MMLSSRDPFDRHHDHMVYGDSWAASGLWCVVCWTETQGPLFPVNGILLDFRTEWENLPSWTITDPWARRLAKQTLIASWLDNWGARIQWANGGPTSSDDRIHAHRALTLLAAVNHD